MSILHLFFAIISVLLVSIAFMALNLFYHLKITSRVNNLEKDIEKKTLEFDALKKERSTGQSAARFNTQADMSTKVFEMPLTQEMEQPANEEAVEEDSIQIVRNVRGTFERTDTVIHNHGYLETPSEPSDTSVRPTIKSPPPAPAVRPIAAATKQAAAPLPGAAGTIIPLFSAVIGGPDFNQLYKSLVEAMKSSGGPAFAFDLSGIESLNAGELEYLEKIYQSLAGQRRSLVFLHCSANLAAMIRHRPHLAPLIR